MDNKFKRNKDDFSNAERERKKIQKEKRKENHELDESLKDTFPASDPATKY